MLRVSLNNEDVNLCIRNKKEREIKYLLLAIRFLNDLK